MKRSLQNLLKPLILTLMFMLLTPALITYGASGERDILGTGTDYTAILYDSLNGLPTSEANAIVQTPDGFIWLGGYSGLIRYDGSNFERFDSSYGIPSVFSLYADSRGRLWIGTNENGIACFDNGDITVFGRSEGLRSYSIRYINEDTAGNILIATTQGMAWVDNEMQFHTIDDPQINTEYITELQKDSTGRVFGLTLSGAVFEISSLRVTSFYEPDSFGEDVVNAIFPDPDDDSILYAGTTESEILIINKSDMSVTRRISTQNLRNINAFYKSGDNLWVSATNGIGFFDKAFAYTDMSTLPLNGSVGNIMRDHEGNMWFTSTRQGVMKVVPDRFTDLNAMSGLPSITVNSTCLYNGLLYLGCDDGLHILRDGSYEQVFNEMTDMLDGVRIRCIKRDSNGNLWFCTHGELGFVCLHADGTVKCITSEDGLDATKVRTCLELSDGRMAAATGNGVFIIDNEKVVDHYGQDQGISNTEILSIAEDDNGKLYLGSDGDGIYVVDKSSVSRLSLDDGLTSGVIMRIIRDDSTGLFWLISSNSIQYMPINGGEISTVNGFPYSNNLDICFDKKGGAWILSSNGVYITRKEQLLNDDMEIEYSFYNTKSGLPYITTGNSRSELTDSGLLYISGTTGVCMVDIDSNDAGNTDVLLSIPCVEVDDKPVNANDVNNISLAAGCKRIVINAYAITYGLSNPRISYYLEGFDDEIKYTTKQDLSPLVYTNLDGGNYTFHLNVLNDTTGEVEKSLSLSIKKESSIYESTLFWLILMAIAIAGTAFYIAGHYKARENELLRKRLQDQALIEQIMHTIAKCVDLRDKRNVGHSFRVAYYTRMLATKLAPVRGYTEDDIIEFYNIALLHDIGKIAIPDAILNKPAKLDDEEYAVMKSHTIEGSTLLRDVDIVKNLAIGAKYHHERLDGKGYPTGLKGDEIPEAARIVAVADTFDAMYSTRPYRKQMELSDVLAEMNRIKGTQLETEVVDALLELAEDGALSKANVDEWVAEVKSPKRNFEAEKQQAEKEAALTKQKNREFLESLGLSGTNDEEDKNE